MPATVGELGCWLGRGCVLAQPATCQQQASHGVPCGGVMLTSWVMLMWKARKACCSCLPLTSSPPPAPCTALAKCLPRPTRVLLARPRSLCRTMPGGGRRWCVLNGRGVGVGGLSDLAETAVCMCPVPPAEREAAGGAAPLHDAPLDCSHGC